MAQDPPLNRSDSRVRVLIGLGLIAVAVCWVYLPALDGQFLWDDDGHVTKPELRSLQGLSRIWFGPGATQQYYPLLHTGFWIQHLVFGDRPAWYHRVNLLLHLAAAGLVYTVLRKLQVPGALLATAIFALHPVQVESVAWITEQKNTLSAVFYLGAMLAYLHFDESREKSAYVLALVLFVLGLFSKTVTATLPAALLVIFWWQRGRLRRLAAGPNDPQRLSWRRDVLPLVPLFALGLVGGITTAYLERVHIGAEGEEFDMSLAQRVLIAGRVIWFYLGKLVWPADLMFWYPRWTVDPSQLGQWLYPIAAATMTVALWVVRRRWRAPLAAWLFFVGTLFPVLGFLNVYPFRFSFVADHFQYLAALGPIVLVSAGITLGLANLSEPMRWIGVVAPAALVAMLAILAHDQSAAYADPITLYEATLAKDPDCWAAHNNLGVALKEQSARAMQHFQRALELKPNYAEAHNNLGGTLLSAGQTDDAIKHFVAAIKLRSDVPDFYSNLGNALTDAGRAQEAIPILEKTVKLDPNLAEAETNLAIALLKAGRPQDAIAHAEKSLRLERDQPEPNSVVGNALLDLQRPREAAPRLEEAVRLKPKYMEAWANLAMAYASTNRKPEALAAAGTALQLARDAGRSQSADQIERWLQAYRAGQFDAAKQPSGGQERSAAPSSTP